MIRQRELFIILAVLSVAIGAWYVLSPFLTIIELEAQAPQGVVLAKGEFEPGIYNVQGTASIIGSNGKRILHFENFKTINAPDLHVYLAFDAGSRHYVDLGKIKATSGSANYEIPSPIDIRKSNTVLIWFEPLRLLFGSAQLK